MRFTSSWNIWMWLHSSVISWMQYRNSGEPFGSVITYCCMPRMSTLSNSRPTLAPLAWRHRPIATCFSSGWAWYQGCAPSGS